MNNKLIITETSGVIRYGYFRDGIPVELYCEQKEQESLVGNIYAARVERVADGIDGAFLEIGQNGKCYYRLPKSGQQPVKLSPGHEDRLYGGDIILVQITKDAVIISALMGATEFHIAHRLFRADRKEFYIFAGAFLGVLVLGTIYGVIIGVLLSFADVIHRASQPKRDFLGVIPGEPGFYPQGRMSQAQPIPGVVLYRFSGSLFFANIALFQQEIEDAVTPETRAVIVDASAIVSVDLSAADRLVVLHQKLARRGVRFYLTEHIGQVNDELRRYGADSLIESGAVRRTLLSALQDCGLWSGPMPRPEEELRRQTQEFEWAYGDEAEERMEHKSGLRRR